LTTTKAHTTACGGVFTETLQKDFFVVRMAQPPQAVILKWDVEGVAVRWASGITWETLSTQALRSLGNKLLFDKKHKVVYAIGFEPDSGAIPLFTSFDMTSKKITILPTPKGGLNTSLSTTCLVHNKIYWIGHNSRRIMSIFDIASGVWSEGARPTRDGIIRMANVEDELWEYGMGGAWKWSKGGKGEVGDWGLFKHVDSTQLSRRGVEGSVSNGSKLYITTYSGSSRYNFVSFDTKLDAWVKLPTSPLLMSNHIFTMAESLYATNREGKGCFRYNPEGGEGWVDCPHLFDGLNLDSNTPVVWIDSSALITIDDATTTTTTESEEAGLGLA